MKTCVVILALFVLGQNALYDSSSKVVQLTKDTFDSLVVNSDDLWLVEFYAPWCGHCKTLAPEFDKAANALKGMVKLGAVDMTQEQSVGTPYDIKGFPTLKVFGNNKKKPTDFNGERTARAIIDQMVNEVKKMANERMSGPKASSSGSSGSSNSHSHSHSSGSKHDDHATGEDVVELTNDNFKELVVDQDGVGWMIIFYAPWCGHCKSAMPEWSGAAETMKKEKKIRFGKINCDEHKSMCGEYGVKGYPTIKWFANGRDEDYQMGRDKSSFISFVEGKKEFISPPKPLQEMVSQEVFNEACVDTPGLCIIAFLPNLLDSSEQKRQEYIEELETIKAKHKGKPLSFLWSEGGSNFDFEDSFGLGFGFPALIAIHHEKKKYIVMRAHYNQAGIDKFIGDLMAGKVSIQTFYQIPKIKTKKAKTAQTEEL